MRIKIFTLTALLLTTPALAANRVVDADQLRSSNRTKTWSLPAATDTLVGRASTDTLTNKTIDAASNTVSNIADANVSNTAAIAYAKLLLTGSIVNADISASAAIAYSKLALSNSIVNADIASGAAIAYSKLALTSSIVNADIAVGAAIAYSKLALTGSIVNADISGSAAIAYSKLNLTGSLVNADISASAAIAYSKLALSNSLVTGDYTANSVTNAKLAQMANGKIKCRTTAGTGDPEDCSGTQVTSLLDVMVGDSGAGGTKGLVPAPAAGDAAAGKFLKADGTFAVPAGSGGTTCTTFSPTVTNSGTISGGSGYYCVSGKFVQIWFKYTSGSPAAATLSLTLPNSYDQAFTDTQRIGGCTQDTNIVGNIHVLSGSTTTVTFGYETGSSAGLSSVNANGIISNGVTMSCSFSVYVE